MMDIRKRIVRMDAKPGFPMSVSRTEPNDKVLFTPFISSIASLTWALAD